MLTNVQRKDELAADGALRDAVALVTGGSRGIGLAIARRLGRMGAKVAICARHPSRLESAQQELAGVSVQALTAVADVTQAAEVAATVARVNTELGPIDILVNCAGLGIFGAFHERSELEWDTVLDTNLKSVFLMSRAVAPEMIRRRRGHIINISSLAGEECLRERRSLLRFKMGTHGTHLLHGGRVARHMEFA